MGSNRKRKVTVLNNCAHYFESPSQRLKTFEAGLPLHCPESPLWACFSFICTHLNKSQAHHLQKPLVYISTTTLVGSWGVKSGWHADFFKSGWDGNSFSILQGRGHSRWLSVPQVERPDRHSLDYTTPKLAPDPVLQTLQRRKWNRKLRIFQFSDLKAWPQVSVTEEWK